MPLRCCWLNEKGSVMDRKIGRPALLGSAVAAFIATQLAVAQPAAAAAKCIKGDREPPYTIGWANIYSIPTWMKQTQGTIEDVFAKLKDQGLTDQLVIMGIFYTVEPAMISDRLINVADRRVESGRHPWNVHEWDVKA